MTVRLFPLILVLAAVSATEAEDVVPADPSDAVRQNFASGQYHRVVAQAAPRLDGAPEAAALAYFRMGSVFAHGLHRLTPALAHYHAGLQRVGSSGQAAAPTRALLEQGIADAIAARYAQIEKPLEWDITVVVRGRTEILAPTQDLAIGRAPRSDTGYRLSSAPLPLSSEWVYLELELDGDDGGKLQVGEHGQGFLNAYTGREFRVPGRDVVRFFATQRQLAPPDSAASVALYLDFAQRYAADPHASWARRRAAELSTPDVAPMADSVVVFPTELETDIPQSLALRPDAVAVVIGNSGYSAFSADVPDVAFAARDAAAVRRYLTRALGYMEGNVLYHEDATNAVFRSLFGTREVPQGRLAQLVRTGRSDVFVYYSGHGAPDVSAGRGYFVPVDCNPDDVRLNGYPLDLFYANLGRLGARSITVVIDACFSGGSEQGMLIGSASPVGIHISDPAMALQNGAVFTSSAGDQISSWYPEMGHGLFTYFFLRGLKGAADQDADGRVTAGELSAYVADPNDGVPYWARRLHRGRRQTPGFHGNPEITVIELPR
jgi:hypothetical protein